MTRDEFFRLACAAGYSTQWHSTGDAPMRQEMFGGELETARLMRFAEAVAAAEREACVKVCDEEGQLAANQACEGGSALDDGRSIGAQACAEAIRARSQS